MFVALGIQHAMRMLRIILSSVTYLALPHFTLLSLKLNNFRKRLWNPKFVFVCSLQVLSETFLILRRIQRDIIINVHRSSNNAPLILVTL